MPQRRQDVEAGEAGHADVEHRRVEPVNQV